MKLSIRPEPLDQEEVRTFLRMADERSLLLYPGNNRAGPDLASLASPNMRFFVARSEGRAVGCGGFAIGPDGTAELKRIFVDPEARGQGVGRRIVEAIEEEARHIGVRLMQLETGVKSAEAISLYGRLGYRQRGPFGNYEADPLSVFMEKSLIGASNLPPSSVTAIRDTS
ncbi:MULTISPECIES: GNAT family N-acetyltransferase [unclassified Sinorhizobium]|uniref:GNAT family N-acetyltransferase n=1 Tax=unclassified Sinorhizobium TaxID=2613772 RepID=UPI0035246407